MAMKLSIVSLFDPKGVNQAGTGLERLNGSLKNFGVAAGLAIAGAIAGLGAYAVSALKASDESNKIVRGLDNMISNTEAFGNSVDSIKKASKTITDFTQEFALLTGISDETFNSLATSFLAAPEIAKMGADGVNRLIKISADAAAATGKDLESVGTALSKALENPETAMAKLQRANIFLSDEQKKTYQTFVDIGDIAGATSFLLDTLETKYKGTAEAANPRLCAQPFVTFFQPVTGSPRKNIASTYVECTLDGAIPIEHQRAMSSRCTNVVTLETDHSPFASKPVETADILVRLAKA
jgi:hypothetical protein